MNRVFYGFLASILFCVTAPSVVFAEVVDNTGITLVSVNGGADTANPGVTCLTIANPVASACTNGFVAIPNNNQQLLSAALAAKSSAAKIYLYYATSTGNFHCSGIVFTPCSVISIGIR